LSASSSSKHYLVGGAVRDGLLGLSVTDKDWVVVGSTPDKMSEAGYRSVGKDFPVFLHPKTNEEYALARTERKVSMGYRGFDICADKSVTLEQDLSRRDLTVNAIAQDRDGTLIDPYGGLNDISNKTLRHVSPAFREDPVRILRTARFAARFHHLGFSIAEETIQLMRDMVNSGEVDALVSERVWQEINRALLSPKPSIFFEALLECGALKALLPEVDALYGIPQRADYHPEIDCGIHTMMVIDRARQLSDDNNVVFAALTHDLGKAITPSDELPSHRMHEHRGVSLVEEICVRFRLPKNTAQLATLVCKNHLLMHTLAELKPVTVVKLLNQLDAFRKPEQMHAFALCCQADMQGRGGDFASKPYPQLDLLHQYLSAAKSVNSAEIAKQAEEPSKIKKALFKARSDAVAEVKNAARK
jgi:tRNA nucleotidyltransferase (CCA-adding enzyme)